MRRLRTRAGALTVALAATAVALARFPTAFRALDNRAAHNASQPDGARDLELADRVGIDRRFLLAARRLVPERARYVVATGPRAPQPTPLTLQAVGGYTQNFLMPRFQTAAGAEWLLCYGCDLRRAVQAPVRVVWRHGPLEIARIGQ